MFERLLIANRSEIACRIIRTCRRLGILTGVVYSAEDRSARHVRLADRAFLLPGETTAETYLNGEAIIAAARRFGAQAIHPGYGFLAENADFARACESAGLRFVGPTPATIEKMGSKAAAKATMRAAGVPVIPGDDGEIQDDEYLASIAAEIGYPVLLKAAMGGGGKGMRLVQKPEDFAADLAAVRREAKGAFGDDRVIVEKYLDQSRHIEVQIFGDRFGNFVHLYERDCSTQRRHQKIIEEAPAPGLDAKTRAAIHRAALAAARAVDYQNAGTVEMIMADHAFYFMEMNTRLQVEHPVTEAITGLDLVEWQLQVAAGEKLPLTQDEIFCRGHAIEARLYAEDPANGFLPSSGTLAVFTVPNGTDLFGPEGLRIDTGYEAGDSIGIHYDPLIAKFIAHSDDRTAAIARLNAALARTALAGPRCNIGFLQALLSSNDFAKGTIRTATIDHHLERFLENDPDAAKCAELLALAARLAIQTAGTAPNPWHAGDGWSNGCAPGMTWRLQLFGHETAWQLQNSAAGWHVRPAGTTKTAKAKHLISRQQWVDGILLTATIDGLGFLLPAVDEGGRLALTLGGRRYPVTFLETHDLELAADPLTGGLHAPMPGKIVALRTQAGDEVAADQPLLIMEAMKMEITLRAPAAGKIAAVHVKAGDFVAADALLIGFTT